MSKSSLFTTRRSIASVNTSISFSPMLANTKLPDIVARIQNIAPTPRVDGECVGGCGTNGLYLDWEDELW